MANDKKALLPLIVALVASLLCFCSPLPAFADEAEDDGPAYEVWQQYQESSVTEFNLYKKVVEDLAYRWFMADDTKRAKVPLQSVALGTYKQLSQYVEDYDTPDEQWQAFYDDFHPSYIVRMYSLVTYEDSLSTWSVSDNYAYQHFKEWYEWFGDGSSGGEGGGDEPGAEDQYVYIPVSPYYQVNVPEIIENLTHVAVKADVWTQIQQYALDNGHYIIAYVGKGDGGSGPLDAVVASIPPGGIKWDESSITSVKPFTTGRTVTRSQDIRTEDGRTVYYMDSAYQLRSFGIEYWGTRPIYYANVDVGGVEAPEPTYPDPTYPVYPEPETPSGPTINAPTYIENNTTTTTVDLQPILDAIRDLNTNLVMGIETMQDELEGWFDNLSGWLELIWKELRSANRWLERIFYKTGGGSSDGPDITIDGDGWWDWLSTIAGMLLGDLAGAVSGLAGAFDVLRGLFPFSVPWDLAALLGLFASDPVTPVFDLPVPFGYVNGDLQSASVHVDLSAWDNVMVAVRSVELAIFALGLALKTRELLKNAEVEQ